MEKPEGYQNIVSPTLRNLDFPVHPGLCGKCGNAAWRLMKGYQANAYALAEKNGLSLICKCMALDENMNGMVLDCDAYRKAVDETRGVPRGDLPDVEYYFGERK